MPEDEQEVTIEIGPHNDRYFGLLLYELEQLRDDMRVGASPFAERLERLIERFIQNTRVS